MLKVNAKYIHNMFGVGWCSVKIAVVGSRTLRVESLGDYLPQGVTELVSGGARGIDQCAKEYALANGLKLTEFLPNYARYRGGAPLVRNEQIVRYADEVLAFWDGQSSGTRRVIELCEVLGKPIRVIQL